MKDRDHGRVRIHCSTRRESGACSNDRIFYMDEIEAAVLAGLKQHPRKLEGRCGACRYLDICNGSSRVRAEQVTGNPWAEDPACYLDDEEIGVSADDYGAERVVTTPWVRLNKVSA